MKKRNISILIFSLVISLLAGIIGSVFTQTGMGSWYESLIKPSFNPPSYLFSPVWTTLFLLMGISLYLVLKGFKKTRVYKLALVFFFIQWVLNILWTFFFFYLQKPLYGLFDIILLAIFIIITIVYFYKINKISAYLLIPYFIWVLFASTLNYYFLILN